MTTSTKDKLIGIWDWTKDRFRGAEWLWIALLGAAVIYSIAEYQLGVLAWGITKISTGAYLGYWIDRTLIKARIHEVPDSLVGHAWIRRALVISATMIALGLTV